MENLESFKLDTIDPKIGHGKLESFKLDTLDP
jgi:hypothetical protein